MDNLDFDTFFDKDKKITHVAFVLDESGSMSVLRDVMIDTFNEQIRILKEETDKDMETLVSFITFSDADKINVRRWEIPVSEIAPLTALDYVPNGWTALFDAIGMTISKLRGLRDAENENSSFLVHILTDGQENNSQEHKDYKKLKEWMTELQKTDRWTITYHGTEPGLATEYFNIPRGNVSVYNMSEMFSGGYTLSANASTKKYMDARKVGYKNVANFYNDDKADAPDDAVKSKTYISDPNNETKTVFETWTSMKTED